MANATSASVPRLSSSVIALFGSMARDLLFGTYRPELHYMRGPGPKCREKRRAETAGDTSANVAQPAIAHV